MSPHSGDYSLGPSYRSTKFAPGTLVHTAAGLVPIEQVRAGTMVWSRDEGTGAWGYKPVTDTFVTHPDTIYQVAYDPDGAAGPLPAATLGTTAPHPFYVASQDGDGDGKLGGFVPAGELVVGDELVLADGSSAWVTGLAVERAAAGAAFTTHNFAVADYHTYFVGEGGVWVHNAASTLCEKAFATYRRHRTSLNASPEAAFKEVEKVMTKYMTKKAFTKSQRLQHMGDVLDQVIKDMRSLPDNQPLFTSRAKESSVQNMWGHWVQHQSDFPALDNAVAYVQKALDFVGSRKPSMNVGTRVNRLTPTALDPAGNPIMERVFMDMANGEIAIQVISGPETGALRTFFPKRGIASDWADYWKDQGITVLEQVNNLGV